MLKQQFSSKCKAVTKTSSGGESLNRRFFCHFFPACDRRKGTGLGFVPKLVPSCGPTACIILLGLALCDICGNKATYKVELKKQSCTEHVHEKFSDLFLDGCLTFSLATCSCFQIDISGIFCTVICCHLLSYVDKI